MARPWALNQTVSHPTYGVGSVVRIEFFDEVVCLTVAPDSHPWLEGSGVQETLEAVGWQIVLPQGYEGTEDI